MLKRLRIKFILINMTIVTIMLGVIFALLYYSTSQNLERESMQMMQNLALTPARPALLDKRRSNVHLPYFSLLIDHEGNVIVADGNFFDFSDDDQLGLILSMTDDTRAESGVLREYNLRFFRAQTPMGARVVFADMTSERSTLTHLVQTLLIVGIAAFLVFLAISIFLARWAVRPVDRAWQQQKQFVADASHELKTPLTVILTDAELLHAPDCPEADRTPLLDSILAVSLQMRGLVESLLDLARIDNGSVKEEFGVVSFSGIASEAAMTFEPVFFEKGLPLCYEIEPDIRVSGVALHLNQLICILLDNAVKYASPGGKTVLKLSRYAHNRCLLEASNQGEPISEEDIKNLFKRFYRVDKARSMNHSYGLGLSIAQSIAEEHRGKIWCESSDGWNRFCVEIPYRD